MHYELLQDIITPTMTIPKGTIKSAAEWSKLYPSEHIDDMLKWFREVPNYNNLVPTIKDNDISGIYIMDLRNNSDPVIVPVKKSDVNIINSLSIFLLPKY